MKPKLVLSDHNIVPGDKVLEIWDGDEFIAEIVAADERGIRMISKYPLKVVEVPGEILNVVEVWVAHVEAGVGHVESD